MAPVRPIVCIADDDPGIRESLRMLLEDAQYEVGEPRDGYEALAMPQAETRPCVMLLDRMMARLDGMETLRRFIELPGEIQRRVTILLMTARSDPLDPSDAAFTQPVILATVQKPFNLDQLLALAAQASGRLDYGGKIT